MKLEKFVVSALAIAAATSPALAQSSPSAAPAASNAGADDAIVVTARRRAEDASKVPLAITAFSGAALETKNIKDLGDLVKLTPGLNIAVGGSKTNPFLTIRGQTRGVTGNIQSGVTTYFNDVPLATQGSLIPTFDLANVQVLKGPQGTLFGRNSLGGSVLVNSMAPTHDFGGYVKVEVGSYGSQQVEGAINVPVMGDVIALRLAGLLGYDGSPNKTSLVTDYTVDPVTRIATPGTIQPLAHSTDEFSTTEIRASLLIEPSDTIKNVTVFDYSKIRGSINSQGTQFYPGGFKGRPAASYLQSPAAILGPNIAGRFGAAYAQSLLNLTQCGTSFTCDYRLAQALTDADPRTQFINSDPWRARSILMGISNTTTIQLGEHATLKNIFGFRKSDIYNNGDNEGSPLFVTATATQINMKQISDELQLSGELLANRLKYTVGGFYYRESPNGRGGQQSLEVNALQGLSHSISTTFLTNTSKAIYGQFDFEVVDGVTLTAGARQTWDSVSGCASVVTLQTFADAVYGKLPNAASFPTPESCANNTLTTANYNFARSVVNQNFAKRDFKKLTYTLGANWQITPDAMVYVVRRRGYRGGSYNTPQFDPFLASVQTFQPEVLEDWEVGAKVKWEAGQVRGSFDLAVFTGKDKGNQFGVGTSGITNICVPAAISASRPTNCNTVASQTNFTAGTPGVSITHAAATTPINGGDLTIRGFELSATLSPFEGVTIGGGIAYVDYTVDKLTLDPNLLAVMRAGNLAAPTTIVLVQQPQWTYNADLDIRLPGKIMSSDVSFNANYKHSGSFVLGDSTVKPYSVADARLTFGNIGDSRVDLSFYVRNLTDEDYYPGTAASSPSSLGADSFIHALPRTYGVSVRYSFGG
jgi:iron complex outermembrane recepter protein